MSDGLGERGGVVGATEPNALPDRPDAGGGRVRADVTGRGSVTDRSNEPEAYGPSMVSRRSPRPSILLKPAKLIESRLIAAPDFYHRVASALVLIGIASGLLVAGPIPFALFVVVVGLIMSWEWSHVVRDRDADLTFLVQASAVAIAIALAAAGHASVGLAGLAVGAAAVAVGAGGRNPLLSALGVLYVGLAGVALVWLRGSDSLGLLAVLYLLFVVGTNDTMAFFVGRTIGGPKLWPAISPKKTWSGSIGGVVSAGLMGAGFALLVPDASPVRLATLALLLAIVALAGDLAESALKRRFGVKDASDLIPGHGGMLDRMDGIVAVAAVAAVIALSIGGRSPASAILIGG